MALTVATWNVNGIRAREEQFLDWLAAEGPDVVCLQEIKAAPDKLSERLCELAGYRCFWHGAGGYSGVGLHLRADLAASATWAHPPFDLETRVVTADLGGLLVASVYVPNGGKDYPAKLAFLAALSAWTGEQRRAGRSLLVCGDLNVARHERDVHPKERKPHQIGTRPEERELLEGLLAHGLTDVGRALDPDNDELFTWWAPWRNLRQRNIGWRIDYVLASDEVAEKAQECSVRREIGTSDHAPVVARFAL